MDQVSLKRIQLLHPLLRQEALQILGDASKILTGSAALRYTHTLRSMSNQAMLYEQGRTRPGPIVTYAKPGYSFHNYGMAIDICLLTENSKMAVWDHQTDFDDDQKADWMEVVMLFKKHGWTWGGDWKEPKRDRPHFQKTFGLTIQEVLFKYKNRDFIAGSKYSSI